MAETLNLTGVLDHIDDDADGAKISIEQIISSFEGRGYGPLLLSFALIELLPTGAIPGVPTLVAVLVMLVAGQLVLGKSKPWIPQKLADKEFKAEVFTRGREKVRPYTAKFDRFIKPRLTRLSTSFMPRVVGGICFLLAMTMPPLELVPFASSGPSFAIAMFAIGLSSKDGVFILLGLICAAAAFGLGAYLLIF